MGKVVQKKPFPVFTVFCIVMAVLIAAAITVNIFAQNGMALRSKTVVKVDDVTISGLDFQYAYMNYANNYYSYYLQLFSSYFGVTDYTATSYFNSNMTWYQYAASTAQSIAAENIDSIVSDLKGTVCLYVDARDQGIELSDESKASIESTVASLSSYAKAQSISLDDYLAQLYATGFKEADFRKMLEISTLASQYTSEITDAYSFTDADCETYYSENRTQFDNYTYDILTIETTEKTESDATESSAAEATTSDAAEATTSDAAEKTYTKSDAVEYLNGIKDEIEGGKTFSDAAGDDAKKVEGVKYSSLTDDTTVKEWVSDKSRKANDIAVIEADSSVSLVMFVSAERDEYKLVSVNMGEYTISYDSDATDEEKATAKANYIKTVQDKVDAWKTEGGTQETFITLAKEIDTDLTDDGLLEDVYKDYFGDEFDAWAFDSTREKGDTLVFENSDNIYLVYFVSQNEVYWKQLATDYLTNDKYTEDYNAIVEKWSSKTTVDSDAAEASVQ